MQLLGVADPGSGTGLLIDPTVIGAAFALIGVVFSALLLWAGNRGRERRENERAERERVEREAREESERRRAQQETDLATLRGIIETVQANEERTRARARAAEDEARAARADARTAQQATEECEEREVQTRREYEGRFTRQERSLRQVAERLERYERAQP